MELGDRIKELRKQFNWTQTELANKADLSYMQIGRYENKKAIPSVEVLQKIAAALETTTDYLINGTTAEQATQHIRDKELLQLFAAIEDLGKEDKNIVKVLIDAFITKRKLQKIA